MENYEEMIRQMNPTDEELFEAITLTNKTLNDWLLELPPEDRNKFSLFTAYQLYDLRGQTKEAEALKPVIEKEIDPDFFKPQPQGVIR